MFIEGGILSRIILVLPLRFYKKEKINNQIESGFQTIGKTSLKRFRINFFYILVIFILFDLELVFIFCLSEKINFLIVSIILFFIYVTLILEWGFNKIK